MKISIDAKWMEIDRLVGLIDSDNEPQFPRQIHTIHTEKIHTSIFGWVQKWPEQPSIFINAIRSAKIPNGC